MNNLDAKIGSRDERDYMEQMRRDARRLSADWRARIGQSIRRARTLRGLTQNDLAALVGVDIVTISNFGGDPRLNKIETELLETRAILARLEAAVRSGEIMIVFQFVNRALYATRSVTAAARARLQRRYNSNVCSIPGGKL